MTGQKDSRRAYERARAYNRVIRLAGHLAGRHGHGVHGSLARLRIDSLCYDLAVCRVWIHDRKDRDEYTQFAREMAAERDSLAGRTPDKVHVDPDDLDDAARRILGER